MENNNKLELLHTEEGAYYTRLTKKFLNRKHWAPKNPFQIKAFIPGTIQEIYVQVGDVVLAGDNVLILEAMKMRNLVTAEVDGTIKAIYVKTGENVAKNILLIDIEEVKH